MPPALTAYVRDRPGYDYLHHCEVDSSNRNFVSDEVVDRFWLLGPAAAHRDKLAELTSLGVTQFNLYLMNGGEEHQLDDYAREVLPRLLFTLPPWHAQLLARKQGHSLTQMISRARRVKRSFAYQSPRRLVGSIRFEVTNSKCV